TQYILNNPPANVNQGGWGILSFAHVGSDTSSLLQWYGNVAEGNVGGVTVHWQDGQWHEFETEVDAVNLHVNAWMDGNLYVNTQYATGHGPVPNAGIDNNEWGMYINHNNAGDGTPQDHCVTTQGATSFWIDDLAVSTQRIGTGGTPPPPAPLSPGNFRLTMRKVWGALAAR